MKIPNHIVLFPDGNRRWAKQKGITSLNGHKQGYNNLLDFSEWCKNKGVKVLTAFGFSTENWNRTKDEVDYLLGLLEDCLIDNSNLFLNLAISYGGRWDILNAVKKIIEEGTPADKIDEKLFESHLSTAGLSAPDFIIRAGGEMRMSNFVLWQAAYSELYFSPKFWRKV